LASRSLGVLSLDLIAKIGGFEAGMDKAARTADKRSKDIAKSIQSISVASLAVGTALGEYIVRGIDAIVSAFPRLIDAAAQFQDLAEMTGASAEDLVSFAVAAGTAGVSMESVAAASIKLTKSLVGVDDESKAAGAAIGALGLNVEEFKKLDPAAQYEAVGKALGEYADGAGKTAVAVALFGKAGAEQLKVFKALEEQGGRTKILTGEQIALADAYADKQAKLRTELTLYASAIATQFLEPMNAFVSVLKDAAKALLGTGDAVTALGVNRGVQAFAEKAGESLAYVLDRITANTREIRALIDAIGSYFQIAGQLASFDLSGAKKTGQEFRDRYGLDDLGRGQQKAGQKAAETFVEAYTRELAASKRATFAAVDPRRLDLGSDGKPVDSRRTLNFNGVDPKAKGAGKTDDPTKKLLENELKDIDRILNAERELLNQRNKFLDLYNSQGLISIQDYYSAQKNILDEATQNQVSSYREQIAALEKYRDGLGKDKLTERADAQGKINEKTEQIVKLQREAGSTALEMGIKQEQAVKGYNDSLKELSAQILELNGNLGAAAGIKFDLSNEKALQRFRTEGNTAAVEAVGLLKKQAVAQAELNKLQQDFSLAQGDLQIAQERITMARDRGTMGEIESLQKSGEANRAQYAILQQRIEAFEKLRASMTLTPEQTQQYERLRLQLEQLGQTLDPLADKFDTLFSDKFSDAFGDFVSGAKSAKDAFKSFANSFAQEIQRMAIKDLTKQLFGGDGGVGSMISKLFGSSVGTSAGGGISGWFSSLFGSGFASGGYTGAGSMFQPAGVVHRGEYVMNAEATKRLGVSALDNINAGGSMGGTVVNNFSISGPVDRRTENQIAAAAGRGVARGMARA